MKEECCRLSTQPSEAKGEDEISMFKSRSKANMADALEMGVALTRGGRGEWESDCQCLVSHGKEFGLYSKCKGSHQLALSGGVIQMMFITIQFVLIIIILAALWIMDLRRKRMMKDY